MKKVTKFPLFFLFFFNWFFVLNNNKRIYTWTVVFFKENFYKNVV
jgi:hypothetical protein